MKILGLSFGYHDSSATLLVDGSVVYAIQEERLTRIKHDASFPTMAIDACMSAGELIFDELDYIVYYECPMLKFERILSGSLSQFPNSISYLAESLRMWISEEKFFVRERISKFTGLPLNRIRTVKHHIAHAASAFYSSCFDEATIITIDGVGERETASICLGKNNSIRQLDSLPFPDSIGLFYSALTDFLGFEVNEGEYKVMGMAGFGKPKFVQELKKMINYDKGRISINQDYFNFYTPRGRMILPKLSHLLGQPRKPGSVFNPGDLSIPAEKHSIEETSRFYANVASSVQKVTEEAVLAFVKRGIMQTGINKVALAGGVALNSSANARIQRELRCELYVHPAAGDSGGSLGAALYYHCDVLGKKKNEPLNNVLLGDKYSNSSIKYAMNEFLIDNYKCYEEEKKLLQKTSELLKKGAVIGWFQDRAEWGPRALGARSILADPTFPDIQQIINEKIKFREPFRPFAPAVLAEHATEYFEMEKPSCRTQPESFMLSICPVKEHAQPNIPAVTHVDGTARVQLVWETDNTMFRKLIESFYRLSGIPILLNTSFNRNGEPIVNSPQNAIRAFYWSGLDFLVIGNYIIGKETVK